MFEAFHFNWIHDTMIRIAHQNIGRSSEPFVIAEMSGNHNQSLARALEIVEAANIYAIIQTHMGKTVGMKVTGAIQGTVWGSGPYTADSNFANAAVHAGAVKVGETKTVKVRLVQDPGAYIGGTANGVSTNPYGRFPTGAFEIVVK